MPATYVRQGDSQHRGDAGQTLAEFAIGLLVLVLLILGVVDLSRIAFARNVVVSAAREGARYVSVHPTASNAEVAQVAKGLVAGIDTNALGVSVTWPEANYAQVEVTYTYHAISAWIGWFIDGGAGTGIVLRGSSQMRRE